MATNNYHFFADANQPASNPSNYIKVLHSTGACGPITVGAAAGADEYRVSNLHTGTFNPTAYAACDSIVCVQRAPNTTLVSIILRPLVQPALKLAPVIYILCKGMLASSLINGAKTALASNNNATKFIWKEQAKKNACGPMSVTRLV